ncbi:F-box protein CPR1-like [Hordeum vulgare subsp. vulgare]|uniref:F-box domain-containing protein n=1 Tax=Hordeum vulgare subsp. vulgare TaxID=112509 RepID=A0A8I6WW71_HORVV|nr:F-box protein CPR1-like [Hordeum vulgare subsp. vulgare]
MAAAASAAVSPPPHHGLPDEIFIWEILVRLPPKALLRCRAVCRAWRAATSARDFLLAHHDRQPTLLFLHCFNFVGDEVDSLDIISFDHRAGVAAADQLQTVARLGHAFFRPLASCDGLVVLAKNYARFSICNPATRQYAPLPLLSGFIFLGMYPHGDGEYRLLLGPEAQDGCFVYTLGSGEPPRHVDIDCPAVAEEDLIYPSGSALFHGSLHLCIGNMIIAFNTTAESFREMRPPVDPCGADLFEMDGMLGMSICNEATTSIDIWRTQDYESEVWALKYRVELPVAEFGNFSIHWWVVVVSPDGHVLVLVKVDDRLLQIDVDGKLVASFHRRVLGPPRHQLKQTLVPHTLFPELEGYVVNSLPFL